MKAQLHESELEMRFSLTCSVLCVGSNLPENQTQSRERRRQQCYRLQPIRDSVKFNLMI